MHALAAAAADPRVESMRARLEKETPVSGKLPPRGDEAQGPGARDPVDVAQAGGQWPFVFYCFGHTPSLRMEESICTVDEATARRLNETGKDVPTYCEEQTGHEHSDWVCIAPELGVPPGGTLPRP